MGSVPRPVSEEEAVLREGLRRAHRERSAAYARLDQALDPDLIEAIVYQIDAAMALCDHFHRALRELQAREAVRETEERGSRPVLAAQAAMADRSGREEGERWI